MLVKSFTTRFTYVLSMGFAITFLLWLLSYNTQNQQTVINLESNLYSADKPTYKLKVDKDRIAITPQSSEESTILEIENGTNDKKLKLDKQKNLNYEQVYDKIDLKLYERNSRAAYDFILSPEADVSAIQLAISELAKIDNNGELIIPVEGGEIRHSAPYAYQEINGKKVEIESSFKLTNGQLGFELGAYDPSLALVIDPEIYFVELLTSVNASDGFASGDYNGGSGWIDNWNEHNDNNNASNGSIRISGHELLLEGSNGSPIRSIQRTINTTGVSCLNWSFDWRVPNNDHDPNDFLKASYSVDGGSNFIDVFDENGNYLEQNDALTENFRIEGISSSSVVLRYQYKASIPQEKIFIDDIEVTSCLALNCSGGNIVNSTQRLLRGSATTEIISLPTLISSEVMVSALTFDEYNGRTNVTQLNEQVKIQFLSNGNVVKETSFTTDIPDQITRGEIITDFGKIDLGNNIVDQIKVVHSEDNNAGFGATDGTPNSVEGVEICLVSSAICENKTVAFDNTGSESVSGTETKTVNYNNIDISNLTNLVLSATLSSSGNLDGTHDWVNIYYTIDNGTEVLIPNKNRDFGDCGADNDDADLNTSNYDTSRTLSGVSNCSLDWTNFLLAEGIPTTGNEIDIRIELSVSGGESITLDDLVICGESNPTIELCPVGIEGRDVFTITFDTDDAGLPLVAGTDNINTNQPYADLFGSGMGVTFSTNAPSTNPLNLFDSNGTGGPDPDLQRGTGWAIGNIPNEDLGNLIIINDDTDISQPDDEGNGGKILSMSSMFLEAFNFDIVDLQDSEISATDFIRFENTLTGEYVNVPFSEFEEGSGASLEVIGVVYGDRSANRITGITATALATYAASTTDPNDSETLGAFDLVTIETDATFGIGTLCLKKVELGAIGNYVWLDENSDGFQDVGEPGIPNAQVDLKDAAGSVLATTFTDQAGSYLFPNLPAGMYFVDVVESSLPDTDGNNTTIDLTQTTVFTNSGDNMPQNDDSEGDFGNKDQSQNGGYKVTLEAGEENLTADFGYNYNPTADVNDGQNTAAIGDRVWIDSDEDGLQDPNEIGVEGAKLTLIGAGTDGIFGTNDDSNAMTTTNSNGYYLFDNLTPGAYKVTVTDDNGASHEILKTTAYTQTGDPDDFGVVASDPDNQTTTPVILAPGDVFLNVDFGYHPTNATELGSIANTIWLDADADQDGPSGTNTGINSDSVNGDGSNAANSLNDDTETPIEGVTVALIRDTNGNGVWEPNEPLIATAITDQNGQYEFIGLPITNGTGTDDYIVWVNDTDNVLEGLKPTYDKDGGSVSMSLGAPINNATSDVLGITAVMNLTNIPVTDVDFGYTPSAQDVGEGLIGDYVWLDKNRDGTQDTDEPGIEGVIVELLDNTSTLIATTATDENGYYYFGGLPLDVDYTVRIPTPGTNNRALAGLENVTDPEGTGSPDNIGNPETLNNSTPVKLTEDFGYAPPVGNIGTLGNLVWEDLNANGTLDGSETAIAGVTLELFRDLNSNGLVDAGEPSLGTETTSATINSNYLFDNLPFGDYVVKVSDEAGVLLGYWHSLGNQNETGSDGESKSDPYGATNGITVDGAVSNYVNADFGYYVKLAAIGNLVFLDDNGDGIQASTDQGINNVLVTLMISYNNGAMITLVDTTAAESGKDGFYQFANLLADEDYRLGAGVAEGSPSTPTANSPAFTVKIIGQDGTNEPLEDLTATLSDQGTDEKLDSQNPSGATVVPSQGSQDTNPQTPASGEADNARYDIGYKACPSNSASLAINFSQSTVSAPDDVVQITYTVVNEGDTDLTNANLVAELALFPSGLPATLSTTLSESGTADNILKVGETWTYTSSITTGPFNFGTSFVATGFFTADGDNNCGTGTVEVANAELLFTVGINVEVRILNPCYVPGQEIEADLITRLLIDEDAAKNPGMIQVPAGSGNFVPLRKQQFEARNLLLTINGVNNDLAFDPFNPPVGVDIISYNDQSNVDDGRNTAMILDECEPINTVRPPCNTVGQNDIGCEFPDWVFRATLTVPPNQMGTFTVTASDDFDLFGTIETTAGSNTFEPFSEITNAINSGSTESANIEECPKDYGDLPDPELGMERNNYRTTASDNGPFHYIDPTRELYIGHTVDPDNGTLQNGLALADDDNGVDDEEFSLPTFNIFTPNVTFVIPVVNNTGESAKFYAFFDWNANGSFMDASETITPITVATQGASNVVLNLTVPDVAAGNQIAVRFRLTTDLDLMNSTGDRSMGPAIDGEVEDYFRTIVLPVEVVSFEAKALQKQILVSWTTASEFNNSHFELERSKDGKTFKSIARIQGQGTTSETNLYEYTDNEVELGDEYYYRLKQVDFDYTYSYSNIVVARTLGDAESISIYPSPVGNGVLLNVNFYATSQEVHLEIKDMMNRTLKSLQLNAQKGWNVFSLDVSELPAGSYVLFTQDGQIARFIKSE